MKIPRLRWLLTFLSITIASAFAVQISSAEAQSATPEKTFFKLYVQIFEQFGATVLDERSHQFFTPREFRTRALAS